MDSLGDPDGLSLGDRLALADGDRDTDSEGVPEGEALGLSLGLADGDADGEGDALGDSLGEALGLAEGVPPAAAGNITRLGGRIRPERRVLEGSASCWISAGERTRFQIHGSPTWPSNASPAASVRLSSPIRSGLLVVAGSVPAAELSDTPFW
jgi:hypothetical protein